MRAAALVAAALLACAGGARAGNCLAKLPCHDTYGHCRAATDDGTCKNNKKSGGHCYATCDPGYQATQHWTLNHNQKNADGYWCKCDQGSGKNCHWSTESSIGNPGHIQSPGCVRVTCKGRVPTPHATECAEAGFKGTCTDVTCEVGYTGSNDNNKYTCNADGHWEGGKGFECNLDRNFCPDAAVIAKQFAGLNIHVGTCSDGQQLGSVCTALCVDGYEFVSGKSLFKCSAEVAPGQWLPEGDPLVCEQRCPLELPPEVHADFQHAANCARTPGSTTTCTARCDVGYEASGSGQYTCGAEGDWTGGNLKCTLTGCAAGSPLGHGTQCKSKSAEIERNKCHPACLLGFHKKNESKTAEYTCQKNGQWKSTEDTVKCNEIANWCAVGIVDAEKHVQIKDDGQCDGKVSSKCTPSCENGTAQVVGVTDQSYKCQANQKWAPGVPLAPLVCEKTCDGEPKGPHVVIREACKRLPRRGCIAECAAGYNIAGGGKAYICGQSADGSTGEWQEGSLECVVACDAGFEPIDMAETNSTIPCSFCDMGRFSYDGVECKECPEHNDNRTKCLRCPEGLGPNRDHTVCEPCRDDLHEVPVDGVCAPPRAPGLPNQIKDLWDSSNPTKKGLEIGVALLLLVALALCCCGRSKRPEQKQAGVLRASFLGGTHKLPVAKLTELDVGARWTKAEMAYQTDFEDSSAGQQSDGASLHRSVSVGESGVARRRRRGSDSALPVMFSNDHIREIQPPEWQESPIGQGSYGVVYKVTWRGREVAVKVLKLPERPVDATEVANKKLLEKVEEITKDFITEVEVCCDLNHPNLVRLLGYADKPRLMIMQELLRGDSMDHQLYIEGWKPTPEQIVKSAHDVALGMEYLHTKFQANDNVHDQPIIHRDLKTPNLLLATRPMEGEDVVVKITDFGLSRDKALNDLAQSQTAMMTGCGSVLWMAPEILLGDVYNEKIDVFSYAMCLVELVDCKLPWSGVAMGAEVPHKVTRGQRPLKQLKDTAARPVDPRLSKLIRDCWDPKAAARPDFTTVILRLEEIMGVPASQTASTPRGSVGLNPARASRARSMLESVSEAAEPLLAGGSRPASPDPELGGGG